MLRPLVLPLVRPLVLSLSLLTVAALPAWAAADPAQPVTLSTPAPGQNNFLTSDASSDLPNDLPPDLPGATVPEGSSLALALLAMLLLGSTTYRLKAGYRSQKQAP